jgi:hypothetical protein
MSHLTMLSPQAHINNCLQIRNYPILDVVIAKHGFFKYANNVDKCKHVESFRVVIVVINLVILICKN